MSKTLKTRIVHKHEIEANWKLAENFIPMKAEMIVYDPDENYNYARFKIGDGETKVNDLPFVDEASKEYTDEAITNVIRQLENSGLTREIVEQLPPIADAKENIIYMVPNDSDAANNVYNEYMVISNVYELIGSTAVDLTPYATKEELGSYATTQYVSGEVSALNQRQDELNSKIAQIPGEKTENGEIFNLYEDTETDVGTIAGISFGKQKLPKNAAIGEYSHAEGISTTAAGKGSHAEGAGVFVSGSSAHGEGLGASYNVKVTKIDGNIITIESTNSNSLLKSSELEAIEKNAVLWYETNAETHEGKFYYVTSVELVKNFLQMVTSSKLTLNTTPAFATNAQLKVILGGAFGSMSHIEGGFSSTLDPDLTKLYGVDATTKKLQHAEGAHNLAIGFASHVEGQYSVALGSHSHAQGLSTSAEGIAASTSGQSTKAIGDASHAGGRGAVAQGGDSLAYGYNTQANGYASVALNSGTKALGDYSFAGGQSSEARGTNNFAFGRAVRTNADTNGQFAVGRHNANVQDAMFIVGNGEDDTNPSNAFVVMKDGSATIKTMGDKENSIVTKAYVDSKNHVIVGNGVLYGTATGDYSVAIMGSALANGATAIGCSSQAKGISSFAGPESKAIGNYSTSFGRATAEGYGDFAVGSNNVASGGASVALGYSSTASGYASVVVGATSKAVGSYSFAGGQSSEANANHSFAFGKAVRTNSETPCQIAFGQFNKSVKDALFIIGNGESDATKDNAFVVMKDGTATLKAMGTSDNSVATKKYVDENSAANKMDKFGTYTTKLQDEKYDPHYYATLEFNDSFNTRDIRYFSIYSKPAVEMIGMNGISIFSVSENDKTLYSGLGLSNGNAQLMATNKLEIQGQSETVIKNVVTPTEDGDAANKAYVDEHSAQIDGLITSSVDAEDWPGGKDITFNVNGATKLVTRNLTIESLDSELLFHLTPTYTFINTPITSINSNETTIKGVITPVEDNDAVNKKYVDGNFVSREEYNVLLDSIIALQEQLLGSKDSIITFSVNTTTSGSKSETYEAKQGMTWAEWCSSEYNTGNFFIAGEMVCNFEGDYVSDTTKANPEQFIQGYVKADEQIIANRHYIIEL